MRTTRPACSSASTSLSSRIASLAVQRSGWKISPESTISLSHSQFSLARLTGSSSLRSSPLAPAPAYSRSAAPSGAWRNAPWAASPGDVGGKKGERPLGVLAVFGEVEMHAADEPPAAVARGEERADGEAALGALDLEGFAERTPQRREAARRQDIRRRASAAPHRRDAQARPRGGAPTAKFPRRRTAPRRTAWRRRASTPGPEKASCPPRRGRVAGAHALPRVRTPLRAARRPRRRRRLRLPPLRVSARRAE